MENKYPLTKPITRHPIYVVWINMRYRCSNPNCTTYKYYGGRGIRVCEEWNKSFIAFYEWAIKSGYEKGLTLDRINGNDGYSPENCRWATRIEQQNNRRGNVFVTYNGQTKTVGRWAKELNISREKAQKLK